MKTKNDYISLAQNRSGKSNSSFRWARDYLLAHPHYQLSSGLVNMDARLKIYVKNDALRLANNDPEGRRANVHRIEPVTRANYGREIAAYCTSESARKSNPEAKRARDDAAFRRNWLRRINREIDVLVNSPVGTLDQITAAADSRTDRLAAEEKLIAQKSIALGKKINTSNIPDDADLPGVLIDGFSVDFARKHKVTGINMIGKDSIILATKKTSYGRHAAGETTWKNGKPVSYTRATHENYVRSFAIIRADDSRTVDYVFHATQVAIALPDGYFWGIDSNGLRAICGADDYHVSAPDLLAKNAVEKIVNIIAANAETRRRRATELLAEKAEIEGIFCCVADSLRAGNCLAGTRGFAERHQLDICRHYHAPELLRVANGETGRVRLVIQAARNQARIDAERGFSLLSEHTLPAVS